MEQISDPIILLAIAVAVLTLFGLICLAVLLMKLSNIREQLTSLRSEQELMLKRLVKEVALNSPTRAAIAAVMATQRHSALDMAGFQKEINALTQNWQEIEDLADKAHMRLKELVDQSPG